MLSAVLKCIGVKVASTFSKPKKPFDKKKKQVHVLCDLLDVYFIQNAYIVISLIPHNLLS